MSAWKEWMQNAVNFIRYKTGYDLGRAKGIEAGRKAGMFEAAMFVTMMKQYGAIELIPTHLLLEALPHGGDQVVKKQAIKLAALHLREMVEVLTLPLVPETMEIIAKYLEGDIAGMTPDEAVEVDLIIESPSYFSSLLFLASKVDNLVIEDMLTKLHLPENKHLLKAYYSCMKNEAFVVR